MFVLTVQQASEVDYNEVRHWKAKMEELENVLCMRFSKFFFPILPIKLAGFPKIDFLPAIFQRYSTYYLIFPRLCILILVLFYGMIKQSNFENDMLSNGNTTGKSVKDFCLDPTIKLCQLPFFFF